MSISAILNTPEKHYPEENDGCLDCGALANSCAFNRFGTLLAVGCRDGRIVLWDLLTRGITRTFTGHSYSVTTLSWSRNGRYIASGAIDGTLHIWDVSISERSHTYHFVSPLVKVQFHPRDNRSVLVCISKQSPVVVDISTDIAKPVPDSGENVIASYNRRGDLIITGNNKGMVTVFQFSSLKELLSVRVTTSLAQTQIKSIEFCSKRNIFLVSSQDRVIRLFDADTLPGGCDEQAEPVCLQRMQDLVNRTMWKSCHFSSDGAYVVAGCSREHILHIYETSTGSLVKILKGLTGEDLWDVAWHPLRPMITSVCSGTVTVWAHNPVENWSAFAPNFSELEENEEYDERESEFDEEDEDRSEQGDKGDVTGDDLEVDVTCVDDVPAYLSSDEENDKENLLNLPVQPDFDEDEDKAWRSTHPNDVSSTKRKFSDDSDKTGEPSSKRVKVVEISADGTCVPERVNTAVLPSIPTPVSNLAVPPSIPAPVSSSSSLALGDHLPAGAGAMLAELAGGLPAAPADTLPVSSEDLSSLFSDFLGANDTARFPQLPQGQAQPPPSAAGLNLPGFVP
ncbi:retinoblastoma-binding protein 5 homolog [Sycon ciliatum]|uniref:retinoblastoma-binding protein 5 homolog n=1 Tax=Sycon ciliatum TaxID=27933 RepID=UPI0020ADDD4F|eukprot:scpid42581/ scgid8047/ Retinoblastoma-binding protein 5; Retinoblastoma-binding protein RBQ-3